MDNINQLNEISQLKNKKNEDQDKNNVQQQQQINNTLESEEQKKKDNDNKVEIIEAYNKHNIKISDIKQQGKQQTLNESKYKYGKQKEEDVNEISNFLIYTINNDESSEMSREFYQFLQEGFQFKNYFKQTMKKWVKKPMRIDRIWGQWIIRNLNKVKKIFNPFPDPDHCRNDNYIIRHMVDAGYPGEKEARQVYVECIKKLDALQSKYDKFICTCCQQQTDRIQLSQNVEISTNQQCLSQLDKNCKTFYLVINELLLNKLNYLFNGDEKEKKFCLFWLVYCHEILDFVIKQYSLPPKVMNTLYQKLNVKYELFASPLNSFFSHYFSLFQIDKFFGSLGSFFSTQEENVTIKGNCQANPPHIECIYDQSAQELINLLNEVEKKNEELLIVYFIPWQDCIGYQKYLKNSEFLFQEVQLYKQKYYEYIFIYNQYNLLCIDNFMLILATSKSRAQWQDKIKEIVKQIINDFESSKDYEGPVYYY